MRSARVEQITKGRLSSREEPLRRKLRQVRLYWNANSIFGKMAEDQFSTIGVGQQGTKAGIADVG